jgi:CheY-like chemotaxis protein
VRCSRCIGGCRSRAITVRDTGIGIAPEVLPAIFNMFVQEHQAIDRADGGLGLGLTIVRSMVELHGGTVKAHSAGRGHGSEFTIRLPICTAEATVKAATATAQQPAVEGRRILVVDDNADAADLLAELLERMGNTTRVAHDAQAALELVDEFTPELADLDLGLPVIDGYELARRLRAHPQLHTMPLVALSGYGQPSDRERSAEAGFDAHLVKPVVVDALRSLIGKLTTQLRFERDCENRRA